jgi:Mrp family chromosome partitioning ATPase
MSKILEALDNAQADARSGGDRIDAAAPGPVAGRGGGTSTSTGSPVSMDEEMIALHQRLDALLPDHPKRVIEFIGSREGEGTSTVVEAFARVSAAQFGRRVLLLNMDPHGRAEGGPGMAGGGTFDIALLPQEFLAAPHTTVPPGPASTWARLRSAYDLILVDAPPATMSPQGLALARQVDGVVLVLAAEDTRWPVAERVKQSIERSGGRVLGVVLNKRQYHIPPWMYRRL